MTTIPAICIQFLALVLFVLGLATTLSRRNLFFLLMGVEVMLNAANLSFVGFSRTLPGEASVEGLVIPVFVIALAAAEACVGLAMLILVFHSRESVDADAYSRMKE
jgi:NADH:ubiquinone oxidoreductase subunit K